MDAIQVHDRVTLESVQQQFSDWRAQRRSTKEPIPDRLWKAAERLCDVYTVGRVSSALRLSFTDLKRRLSGSQFDKEKSVPFLELEVGSLCSGQWELECIRADGGRLRMSATGGLPPLGDLLRGFWS